MAFTIQNWARQSVALNTGLDAQNENGPTLFTYQSQTDNIGTISAANYFADVAYELAVHDLIFVNASDGFFTRRVTAVNASAGTVTVENVGLFDQTSVAITAAEFNGMYAAPKLLIPAAGANTLLVLHRIVFEVEYGAAQFANGGNVAVQYSNTANGGGHAASATIAAASFTGINADAVVGAEGALAVGDAADTINEGLYLSNATAAFDTGDSDMIAHVWYSVMTTAI